MINIATIRSHRMPDASSKTKEPRLEIQKTWMSDTAEIVAAREKGKIIHSGKDIRAAGNEVEQRVRKLIEDRLGKAVSASHGHIVDSKWRQSPQLDVIVAERLLMPPVWFTADGTEYVPYEAVYAVGEIKASYDPRKKEIENFVDKITGIQNKLKRAPHEGHNKQGSTAYGHPLFSFMIFAGGGNNFQIDHISELYKTGGAQNLPTILCFIDKGLVFYAARDDNGEHYCYTSPSMAEASSSGIAANASWYFWEISNDHVYGSGAPFAYLLCMLREHILLCHLPTNSLMTYMSQACAGVMQDELKAVDQSKI